MFWSFRTTAVAAAELVPVMAAPDHFLHGLYIKAKAQGLILGACKACSAKLKVTEAVTKENIPLIGEMAGHPSMADFIDQGYTILTF